jgi:hypothetical protein
MKKIIILSLILFFSLITASYATTINFRSNDFLLANDQPSFYYSPAGLTITAQPENAVLYQDSTDGLGIKWSYENDEIEEDEILHLGFDMPYLLHAILITDLFYEPENWGNGWFKEEGQYSINGGDWVDFIADESQIPSTNGELSIIFSEAVAVSTIEFQAPGWKCCGMQDHEFSLGEIDISPIPEPSTMLLFISSLVGLVGFRRKLRR